MQRGIARHVIINQFNGFLSRLSSPEEIGADMSRDIEPTVEGGALMFDIMRSCLRVAAVTAATGEAAAVPAAALTDAACVVANEVCCVLSQGASKGPLWQLLAADGATTFPTASASERLDAVTNLGYAEICTRTQGAGGDFCVNSSAADVGRVPFLVATSVGSGRVALYRCDVTAFEKVFLTTSSSCDDKGSNPTLMGFIATARTSEFRRALRRCGRGDVVFYSTVDSSCDDGDVGELIGWVG